MRFGLHSLTAAFNICKSRKNMTSKVEEAPNIAYSANPPYKHDPDDKWFYCMINCRNLIPCNPVAE